MFLETKYRLNSFYFSVLDYIFQYDQTTNSCGPNVLSKYTFLSCRCDKAFLPFPVVFYNAVTSLQLCVVSSFISITEDESCFLSEVLLFQGLSGWGAACRLGCWWLDKSESLTVHRKTLQRKELLDCDDQLFWGSPGRQLKVLQKLVAGVCWNSATSVSFFIYLFN